MSKLTKDNVESKSSRLTYPDLLDKPELKVSDMSELKALKFRLVGSLVCYTTLRNAIAINTGAINNEQKMAFLHFGQGQ